MSGEHDSSFRAINDKDSKPANQTLESFTQDCRKVEFRNREFNDSVNDADFSRGIYIHIYAVGKTFKKVNFEKCNWTNCYFRNCKFINCDFTGCSFKESNFKGSEFQDCKLRYTFWDKTLIDESILDSCWIPEENLMRDIVRSLRVNFAQIGNQDAVNKAILMEIKLTGAHILNIAKSKQEYFRRKRDKATKCQILLFWLDYCRWLFIDFLCGFGEKPWRVFIWILLAPLIASLIMQLYNQEYNENYLWQAHEIFWGLKSTSHLPSAFSMFLIGVRYLLLSLFTATLVKRLLRR